MKVDGRILATALLEKLKVEVSELKKRGIHPHLAVVLVGDDPASIAYVRQKKLRGESIGIHVSIHEYTEKVTEDQLLKTIGKLNNDNNVHGIIVQQPLPPQINLKKIENSINPKKDVDGFHENSSFTPPIAEAAIKILEYIFTLQQGVSLSDWLMQAKIVVIGKGETGGKPIAVKLKKLGITPLVIDSKTPDPQELTKKADIIISCVGKKRVITGKDIKQDAILLSIGMHRGDDGKLHGDYDEEDINNKAGYYTPVPGGVGPVTVAMLLKNTVSSLLKCSY